MLPLSVGIIKGGLKLEFFKGKRSNLPDTDESNCHDDDLPFERSAEPEESGGRPEIKGHRYVG